jgi:hypothetical protein
LLLPVLASQQETSAMMTAIVYGDSSKYLLQFSPRKTSVPISILSII